VEQGALGSHFFLSLARRSTQAMEATKKGAEVLRDGSPEWRVMQLLPPDGSEVPREKVEAALGAEIFKAGHGVCAKNKWITATKTTLARSKGFEDKGDVVKEQLSRLEKLDDATLAELKKRALVGAVTYKAMTLGKGPHFNLNGPRELARDLTHEMLMDDSWQTQAFKSMNKEALGQVPESGALHPLLKARTEYRQVFLEMGFQEMPTARYVESSFWNFDSLFQPQQHPVRDAHDTFFIKEPACGPSLPAEYWQRVKQMHESGGHGSIGWRYEWSEEESRKNLLRTHTTAVSSRMLHKLAQDCKAAGGVFSPKKYFSIDRVFRNEALDMTHLAEFFQIEGLVADVGLTLGDLMGLIEAFFVKLGLPKLRFKPAYNPYTEPSMEIFSWHEGLGKYVEVGNSGMFRPEMLLPMGLPPDVRVVAWGLGLERPTMIRIGCSDVRDLCGYQQPVANVLRNNPIVRLGAEHNTVHTKKE
jgi:phenylalanyl-tRNA synthetase alpha chain